MIALGRLLIAMALLALAGITVGAQSYHIRIEYNTNIRAEPSLNGRRIETAPAGTVLEVLSQSNRWLRVNRSGGAWIAAWVSHQRVDAAPAVSNPADTDNCCGINRVCRSDQEWVAGYWDFQRGLCSLPAQTQSQSRARRQRQLLRHRPRMPQRPGMESGILGLPARDLPRPGSGGDWRKLL